MPRPPISVERLRELLEYDAETGVLTGRTTRCATAKAGAPVGGLESDGYLRLMLDRRSYKAHRLAWLHHYGEWPPGMLDHINGDPTDNRIANLRMAPEAINQQNLRKPHRDSKTGVLGVTHGRHGRFQAQLRFGGKIHHLGTFDSVEEAGSAYLVAKRQHHEGCTV